MKGIINEFVRLYLSHRMRGIERFMSRPFEAQRAVFDRLLEQGRATEFGQLHGLDAVKTPEDFARRVPIHDYDALKPSIQKMMRGEADVLVPGVVHWFSKSSGTTSDKSKFIPVPDENLFGNHIAGAWNSLAFLYDQKPGMRIFAGRNLLMPGSWQHFEEHPATCFGDISAILAEKMPAIARISYAPDREIALLKNFEEKLRRTAETCAERDDIVMFGGVPTWNVVLFRMILEKTGKSNMLEVWPNLQAYMHGGVGFEPYRKTFRELFPSDDMAYIDIYNASEGYFGAQNDLSDPSLLLFLDSDIYYEFLPLDEIEKERPQTVPLEGVRLGENYALVITTSGGLWRYTPGDTICFTSVSPFKFKISGRTKQFINAFGEELMVGDADKAIAATCAELDCAVAEFTAAPFYFSGEKGKGGHEWIVEFEKSPADSARFAAVLDENLKKINSDYEAKRFKGMAMEPLKMRVVPHGTFLEWMRSRGKFGNQNKVPRLANNRQFVEELIEFSSKKA